MKHNDNPCVKVIKDDDRLLVKSLKCQVSGYFCDTLTTFSEVKVKVEVNISIIFIHLYSNKLH